MAEDYIVQRGDCLSSIAFEHGFFWETLWNDAPNASLKSERKDPSILQENDVVHIPDLREKEETGGSDQRHRFKRKGVPARFRLRLMRDDQPWKNAPFELTVDGKTQKGSTDGDGRLDVPLPPNAQSGTLSVGTGPEREMFDLDFGQIDPVTGESGVAGRLANLGFTVEPDLSDAIRSFQGKYGLTETGEADDATRAKLQELFGE
jgi:hypothetical protein